MESVDLPPPLSPAVSCDFEWGSCAWTNVRIPLMDTYDWDWTYGKALERPISAPEKDHSPGTPEGRQTLYILQTNCSKPVKYRGWYWWPLFPSCQFLGCNAAPMATLFRLTNPKQVYRSAVLTSHWLLTCVSVRGQQHFQDNRNGIPQISLSAGFL